MSTRKKTQPPITTGAWRTRRGREAIVAGINPDAGESFQVIGWIDGIPETWTIEGKEYTHGVSSNDLIRPWVDKPKPPEWDWSKTSPWHNWLVADRSGECWYLCSEKPTWSEKHQSWTTMSIPHQVPAEFAPKWKGHTKDSLSERPAK